MREAAFRALSFAALTSAVAACTGPQTELTAGWALVQVEVPRPHEAGDYKEGKAPPEPYTFAVGEEAPAMYVQLLNTGRTAGRIERVALNRSPDKHGGLPPHTVQWEAFELAPGEIKFLPVPALQCELPAWLYVRFRHISGDSLSRARDTIVPMQGVLLSSLPRAWLAPSCISTPLP